MEKVKMKYVVITGATLEILMEKVKKAIKEQDMSPEGGIAFDGRLYLQAMVSEDEE